MLQSATSLIIFVLCTSCGDESVNSSRVVTPLAELAPVDATTLITPRSVDWALLDQGLTTDDYMVRLLAIETLGCVSDGAALVRLNNRGLADPVLDVRAAAVEALWHHNSAAARALLASVRDDAAEDLSLRILASRSLLLPSPTCH